MSQASFAEVIISRAEQRRLERQRRRQLDEERRRAEEDQRRREVERRRAQVAAEDARLESDRLVIGDTAVRQHRLRQSEAARQHILAQGNAASDATPSPSALRQRVQLAHSRCAGLARSAPATDLDDLAQALRLADKQADSNPNYCGQLLRTIEERLDDLERPAVSAPVTGEPESVHTLAEEQLARLDVIERAPGEERDRLRRTASTLRHMLSAALALAPAAAQAEITRLTPEVERLWQALDESLRDEQHRLYVIDTVSAVLHDLGYDVAAGQPHQGAAPGQPTYIDYVSPAEGADVRIGFDRHGNLVAEVVRCATSGDPQADARASETEARARVAGWCATYQRLLDQLRQREFEVRSTQMVDFDVHAVSLVAVGKTDQGHDASEPWHFDEPVHRRRT